MHPEDYCAEMAAYGVWLRAISRATAWRSDARPTTKQELSLKSF